MTRRAFRVRRCWPHTKIWLALAIGALMLGLWAGLARLRWPLPVFKTLPGAHGPLMISGFLGALIGLERAVALRTGWGYLAPALAAVGTLIWAVGVPAGALGALGGSAALIALYFAAARVQLSWPVVVMGAGAICWGIGNVLWGLGQGFSQIVPWWGAFLVLTIAGERLELARLRKLSGVSRVLFVLSLGLIGGGLLFTALSFVWGVSLMSAGVVALALWLLRYDLASHTVHQTGLVRYIAVSLLVGYCWLGLAGIFGMMWGKAVAGPSYDALWHALFVGFVFSMILGHAPVILPALVRMRIPFSWSLYVPLALLHLSLITRVVSDWALWLPGRRWGGLLNAIAVLVFFANTGRVALSAAILPRLRPR